MFPAEAKFTSADVRTVWLPGPEAVLAVASPTASPRAAPSQVPSPSMWGSGSAVHMPLTRLHFLPPFPIFPSSVGCVLKK